MPSSSRSWKASLVFVCLTVLVGYKLDWEVLHATQDVYVRGSTTTARCSRNQTSSRSNLIYASADTTSLHPGELPGYTGWARPEHTLAKYFKIEDVSTDNPTVGQPFIVTVECQGHEDCDKDAALFFLRAYGPAVIPGTVSKIDNQPGAYRLQYAFHDPGQYTVEAVLTFSTAPSIDDFPVQDESQQSPFEGYMLPDFPLIVTVGSVDTEIEQYASTNTNDKGALCTIQDMTVTSTNEAIDKARWVVTGKSNAPGYVESGTAVITKEGYIQGINALGIQMDYQYLSTCTLLPESTLGDQSVFANCPTENGKKLHIIYIGDSVLRVQKIKLEQLTNRTSNFEFHFLPLPGGFRRNQISGSNVTSYLEGKQKEFPKDPKAVLFNTGLHDIHQLCGAENTDDRRTYLDPKILESGSFSCTSEYRALLQEIVTQIQQFPAQLKVFQTTTAAWPKYGNWGIGWEANAQNMPLVSDFSHAFNEIAVDVVNQMNAEAKDKIHIMDAYWMTYARPDNREIGDIGNKLSHPGDEVLSVMARMWSKTVLDAVC